jgi:hypothetical protein
VRRGVLGIDRERPRQRLDRIVELALLIVNDAKRAVTEIVLRCIGDRLLERLFRQLVLLLPELRNPQVREDVNVVRSLC